MKILYSFLLSSLLLLQNSFSQIPNSDFESWVFTGWYEDPASWVTNNTQIMALMVIKDEDAYSGQYAVQLFTSNNLIPILRTGFSITDHPAHLNAYVKSSISPDDSVYLLAALYNNGALVDYGILFISNTITNYTQVSVPIPSSSTVVDSAVIEIYGGLKYGTSLKVDHLEFDYLATGVQDVDRDISCKILHNPFHETLELNNSTTAEYFTVDVFTLEGKKVFHTVYTNNSDPIIRINTSEWNAGSYLCVIRNDKEYVVGKIMKQ